MSNCVEMRKQLNLDILNEWLKTGTMLLVARFLQVQQKGGNLLDKKWMETTLFTLLGFTTYHIVTKQFVSLTHPNRVMRNVINTWLKVGTMLVVSRLLSKQSLTDESWLTSSMYTLLGFTTFDVFTHKFVPKQLKGGYKDLATDAVAFVTMFVVSRTLEGKPLDDMDWIKSSLYTIVGIGAYDLVGQYVFPRLVNKLKNVEQDVVQMVEDAKRDERSNIEAEMQAQMEEAEMQAQMEEAQAQEAQPQEAEAQAQEAEVQPQEAESTSVEGFNNNLEAMNSDNFASVNF